MKRMPLRIIAFSFLTLIGHSDASVSGFISRDFRWAAGATIPVCFENPNSGNLAGRQMVEYVIKNSWEKVANINFDFKTTACATTNQGIMVKISDTERATCGTRTSPHPGRPSTCTRFEDEKAVYAKMQLNFTYNTFKGPMSPVAVDTALRKKQVNRMIFHHAIHEFGHALGFLHEDDRVDGKRDAGAMLCSDDDGERSLNGMPVSYYDIHSVMHYLCNHAGNWQNGPPVTLSCGDMATVRWMYGDRNTHIGPTCLKAHATNLDIPANLPAGYFVPAGSYDIGSGADTYQPIVNPVYTVPLNNNWGGTRHRTPGNLFYYPTVEPKVSMGISPESQVVSGAPRQGYRITFTYNETNPPSPGTAPSQIWLQELTLMTIAGPKTVYRDQTNPADNKPLWAYPKNGEYNTLFYDVYYANSGRSTAMDQTININSGRMSPSNRTWSVWVPKGQGAYRSPQDEYGFLFIPPLPALRAQPANEDGLHFADMNFYVANAKITYWDGAWYESINIKGTVPRDPGFVRYFIEKKEIVAKSALLPILQSPTKFLQVDRTEVTHSDYFFIASGRIPNSRFMLDFTKSKQPIGQVTWFDAIVYCNLRSELEGLEKVYSYSNAVYGAEQSQWKGKCIGMSNLSANLKMNGYRLPTEEEWKSVYSHPHTGEYFWSSNQDPIDYAWFGTTTYYARDVGLKKPTPRGIFDIAGNSAEYIWGSESGDIETSTMALLKGAGVEYGVSNIGKSWRLSRNKHDHWPTHSFRTVRTVPGPANSQLIMTLMGM